MKKKIKIVNIVGARPNFMKIAPLFREYKNHKDTISPILVHTSQHKDERMSGTFFRSLGIPKPKYQFSIDTTSPSATIAQIMTELEKVLEKEKPDLVLVVGDVNSTLAGTITANKMGIKVAHIEAGLRSGDRKMPEEINRIAVDHISDLLFVTENDGMKNLKNENIPRSRVFFTGNVMIDNLVAMMQKIETSSILKTLGIPPKEYVIMTMHRPSNVDSKDGLLRMFKIIHLVSEESKRQIVFPVHPRTLAGLKKFGILNELQEMEKIILAEPMDYVPFMKLVKESAFVITDSGGIQEEAAFLKIPTITLRESTERPSTVDCGANFISPPGNMMLLKKILKNMNGFDRKKIKDIPMFDGMASKRIIGEIVKYFS